MLHKARSVCTGLGRALNAGIQFGIGKNARSTHGMVGNFTDTCSKIDKKVRVGLFFWGDARSGNWNKNCFFFLALYDELSCRWHLHED